MTKLELSEKEARLVLELCEVAYGEGLLSEGAYEFGKKVRDTYFPGEKQIWIKEDWGE